MRILSTFLLALFSLAAFAQTAAEAPVEKASAATIIVFVAFFVVSCVGYFAYAWWSDKKEKAAGQPATSPDVK